VTRKIVQIDATKCMGVSCARCVLACCSGALGFEDGKAKLLHKDKCDGTGKCCIPVCQVRAISLIEETE